MKHHNHFQYARIAKKLDRRAQAALDYVTVLAIGVGLAAALVKWWTS